MKETRFIAQNKEKWLESEKLLISPVKDPEKLSSLFTQIVDDLSYSRTYYPNRSIRVYLNKIARQYFSIIYSHQKEKSNRFKLFWLDELPQIMIFAKKQMLISLIVFLFSLAIGIFSAYKDPQFAGSILGQDYVTMTQQNIDQGDPMAVYKKGHQVDMFLGITLNNLRVAFQTYVLGIFMAIGTLAVLLYNGIMVGCFQFFFFERGLFMESALTIWLHGTLEISAIILSGGAGLTLGSGLLFPGTYSRLQAFQISAMRSLKLMLGIAPIIIFAAIIESFLTRYTDVPDSIKVLLILLSATFIIGYFVIYPWRKSKAGFESPLKEIKLAARVNEPVSYTRLKNNAEIIKDTFMFYSRFAGKLLPWMVGVSFCGATARYFLDERDIFISITSEWWYGIFDAMIFALKTPAPVFILINAAISSFVLYPAMKLIDDDAKKKTSRWSIQAFLQTTVIAAAFFSLIYLGAWGVVFAFVSFGFLLMIIYTQIAESCGLFYGISKAWTLITANTKQLIELKGIMLLLCFSFLLVLSAPLFYLYTNYLSWNFAETDVWAKNVIYFIEMFTKTLSFSLILPIAASGAAYLYYTLEEVSTAYHLKEAIEKMGMKAQKQSRR